MVKVCHLTVAHQAQDNRIFKKECISLHNSGYDVSLVAPNVEDTMINGIKIYGVKTSPHPLYRLFFGAKKVYKKAIIIDADIYHFHDIELYRYGLKLSRKGKKVIFDSHEDWPMYISGISWVPVFLKTLASSYLNRLYKKTLSEFDAVITVSPHIEEKLINYTDSVCVVANYPILNDKLNISESYDTYINRFNQFIYAGTVYKDSNQETIITAIQEFSDLKYLIVGIISDAFKENLKVIDKAKRVEYVPFVPKEQLQSLYKSSICGLVILDYSPNCGGKNGTMGNNKVFEYMEEGLPIICTDFYSWENLIVNKYKCGICVKPRDVNSIKNAIDFILSNKRLAFEMGKNGREAILKEFNWNSQSKVLIDLYEKLNKESYKTIDLNLHSN